MTIGQQGCTGTCLGQYIMQYLKSCAMDTASSMAMSELSGGLGDCVKFNSRHRMQQPAQLQGFSRDSLVIDTGQVCLHSLQDVLPRGVQTQNLEPIHPLESRLPCLI